jgi:hypothetical protein
MKHITINTLTSRSHEKLKKKQGSLRETINLKSTGFGHLKANTDSS